MQELLQKPKQDLGTVAWTTPPEGFLRGLIQGMRCGILTVDRTGRLLLLNDLARQILETGPEVAAGQARLDRALARAKPVERTVELDLVDRAQPQ